jgi:hypothetical protein
MTTKKDESKYARLNGKASPFVVRIPADMRRKLDFIHFESKDSVNKIILRAIQEFISRRR